MLGGKKSMPRETRETEREKETKTGLGANACEAKDHCFCHECEQDETQHSFAKKKKK